MKLGDALQVIGVAAMVSIGGIATIKKLYPPQLAVHDNDIRFPPVSELGKAQLHAPEDAGRVSKILEARTEKPQLASNSGSPQAIPQRKRHLVAVVKNADGTFKDVYADEVPRLSREEDAFSTITLFPGQFPSEISNELKMRDDPLGADLLEMNRQIRTGVRTAEGDLAEQLLRNQFTSHPELLSLNFNVSCTAKLCELQAVRALPGVTIDSIEAALHKAAMTKGFADQYRLRTALQMAVGQSPYWIWYWEKRE